MGLRGKQENQPVTAVHPAHNSDLTSRTSASLNLYPPGVCPEFNVDRSTAFKNALYKRVFMY